MPRWFLVVFGILLAVAIWSNIREDAADDTPSWGDALAIDRYADMEAAATILAKARAEEAFKAASGDALAAARTVALKILLDGGCIDWEMSEWDPSRGMAERAVRKSRSEAESTCNAQADDIARRVEARLR